MSETSLHTTFERGDEVEIASRLLDELQTGGPLTVSGVEVYQYHAESGLWHPLSDDQLSSMVSNFAGALIIGAVPRILKISSGVIRGVLQIMKSRLRAVHSPYHLEFPRAGVAFADCFVHVAGGVVAIEQHRPENMAVHGFPFSYDPNGSTSQLQQFFSEIFGDLPLWDATELILLLQEFIGASLVGEATRYQKCIVVYGPGNNGKSALLEILAAVFPPGSVASLPPQDWNQRFRTASLLGKLVNIVNEIPEREIVASAVFKSIVSGEPLTAEYKMLTPFRFSPLAGHIFSANTLPATSDHSLGFWRRIEVVPLSREMSSLPNCRPDVAKEIIRLEHPGLVAWAIQGAARAQQQGGYQRAVKSSEAVSRWRRDADSVALFVAEGCAPTAIAETSGGALYGAYRQWASANGFKSVSSMVFLKRLNGIGHHAVHTRGGNVYHLKPLFSW